MTLIDQGPILVPTELADWADSALEVALELSADSNPVHALHVLPPAPLMEGWGVELEELRRQSAERALGEWAAAHDAVGAITHLIVGRSSNPGAEIATYAEEQGAGLIVLPSHGRTGIEHLLIGSVAERVIRRSPCPVLVLRGERKPSFESVLVPVDFSEASAPSLQAMAALVPDGGTLHVAHMTPPITTDLPGVVRREVTDEYRKQRVFEGLHRLLDQAGVDAKLHAMMGDVGSCIVDLADQLQVGLVAMPSVRRSTVGHMLIGSVAERVVRLANCPVLVWKP